jgi:CHAD domain-containing protein
MCWYLAAMSVATQQCRGRLKALDSERPLAEALASSLEGVLRYALRKVREIPRTPAAVALHEYRKSVRRARAVLELVRSALKPEDYRELSGRLRCAVGDTSALRDVDALATRVAELDLAGGPSLERGLRAQQDERRTLDVLQLESGWLGPVCDRFRVALPRLSESKLHAALRDSFKRTREARSCALDSEKDDSLHRWRKRVKELRYQLELFDAHSTPEYRRLSQLSEELGEVTDLAVLRARISGEGSRSRAGKKLSRRLARKAERRKRRALRRSKSLFSLRPKSFVRRVVG